MISFPWQSNTQGFAGGPTVLTPDPLLAGAASARSSPSVVYPPNRAGSIRSPVRIYATFPQPMLASSITTATFTVSTAAGPLAGAVWVDPSGCTAYFTPVRRLIGNTLHTATLGSGVESRSGTPLLPYTWSFTTAPSGGEAAPSRR